ncbi:MAG TPA: hypothetical protein VH117_10765 [Edaphobacter sp.]|nr:hypothetical protein [Edaphobacter sp.]
MSLRIGLVALGLVAGLWSVGAGAQQVVLAKLLHSLDRGTIAVGKRADLLVVDADPLTDIRNTQKIFAVYHDGRSIADLPGK